MAKCQAFYLEMQAMPVRLSYNELFQKEILILI